MAYINRRLAITINGESRELSDRDFFLLNGPLVVLGEPGAGKSEIVRQLTLVEIPRKLTTVFRGKLTTKS